MFSGQVATFWKQEVWYLKLTFLETLKLFLIQISIERTVRHFYSKTLICIQNFKKPSLQLIDWL